MIASLLIANRGEIACRIMRTARALGVRTVAVYSDADAHAPHVAQADAAVHIGPSPARESYLVGERIIAAARETGAEAIHPGYGFLSENAEFAQGVIDAGLIWVGPRPASIRAMGLKDAAKALMHAAGVPVTPGYLGEDQSAERLAAEADAIGYPVLVKAVAGGGGKGMRRVDAAQHFGEMLASCRREAAASFGDNRVLIEKYVTRPRHIEVQLFGDTHGNLVHLFERDCSLQRRHQKVIEEAPAPGMDDATRAAICDAALKAGRAVDYVGAGTVEFIADASEGLRADRIWFMEMNTRLQVEHPVTEAITGVDLVEWQLRVASGEPLPLRQEALAIGGHAIEARLYAEDAARGFLPSVGPLARFDLPRHRIRVDAGVEQGGAVTPFYDPMIAKLIAHAADRDHAIDALADATAEVDVWPVVTNAAFVIRALRTPAFRAGDVDTGFIERHGEALIPPAAPDADVLRSAAVQAIHSEVAGEPVWTAWPVAGRSPLPEPRMGNVWREALGFRLNAARRVEVRLSVGGETHTVSLDDCEAHRWNVAADGADAAFVQADGRTFRLERARDDGNAGGGADGSGAVVSPMPGRIVSLAVAEGDRVARGATLVVLEAMKMEQALVAPFDGVVAAIGVAAGAQVAEGVLLARVEAEA